MSPATFPRPFGPYVLLSPAGEGGMGRICLGVTGRPAVFCVVKTLSSTWQDDPKVLARFQDEADISLRLHHPNIVHTFDAGEIHGRPYIAQELLMGRNVEALRRSSGTAGIPLPIAVSLLIGREVANALAYAHDFESLGLVHRDVSPTNIHIGYGGQVKLLDFGLAKWDAKSLQTKTGEGALGKALYMPPEQLAEKQLDARTDVYALGIVLWELLANKVIGTSLQDGRAVPPREGLEALIRRIREEPLPPPSTFNPDVPPVIDAIVLRAAAKDPAGRFQSAAAMRDGFDQVLRSASEARQDLGRMMQAFPERVERERREGLARAAQPLLDNTIAEWESLPKRKAPSIGAVAMPPALESDATAEPDRTQSPRLFRVPAATPAGLNVSEKEQRAVPERVLANITPSMRHIRTLATATVPAHHGQRLAVGAGVLALLGGVVWMTHQASKDEARGGSSLPQGASQPSAVVPPGPAPRTVADAQRPPPSSDIPTSPTEVPTASGEYARPAPFGHLPSPTPAPGARPGPLHGAVRTAVGRKLRGGTSEAPKLVPQPSAVGDGHPAPSSPESEEDDARVKKAEDAIKAANVAFDAADYDAAIFDGKRAVAAGGGGNAHAVLGRAYFAKHMFSEASRELRVALKMNPADKESRRRLEWLKANDHLDEATSQQGN